MTDFAARARYRVAEARHRYRKERPRSAPTVVFGMPKSGTTAVASALSAAGVRPVFQIHDLDATVLADEERQYHWSGRPWRVWDAKCLLRRPPSAAARWRVVSMVRDPVAQCVSAFFQPGIRRGYVSNDGDIAPLLERFADRFEHLPLRWFETRLQPALGIDVFDSPFDPDRGYHRIATANVDLLLLRCEGFDVAPHALAELIGREQPITVPMANVGRQKAYGDVYARFVAAVRPSAEVLERAYSSRLVQHFYTPDEIERFRTYWSMPRAGLGLPSHQ